MSVHGDACSVSASKAEVELLKTVAREWMSAGQGELDLGLDANPAASKPQIVGSRAGLLWQAIVDAFTALGLDRASGDDQVFLQLVAARIIEPTSKLDSARAIEEAGFKPASYPTMNRRLPVYAIGYFRQAVSAALSCSAAIGPASLILYDVTTLYFQTDQADEPRKPGFSKERRLEPQIVVGLLADASGFPLEVTAFEGNKAETHTMLPVIRCFMQAHRLTDVTIVADAGMVPAANKKALEAEGLSLVIGEKVPRLPNTIVEWQQRNPGLDISDGQIFTQAWPAGPKDRRRDHAFHYQHRADRASRALRDIDEQVAKAKQAIAGKAAIKRNRIVQLSGGRRSLNTELEDTARYDDIPPGLCSRRRHQHRRPEGWRVRSTAGGYRGRAHGGDVPWRGLVCRL